MQAMKILCALILALPLLYEESPSEIPTAVVTVYYSTPSQTDDTPFITADGTDLRHVDINEYKICAVSRDLLYRWGGPIKYGDTITITGLREDLDGVYHVHDTMHPRYGRTSPSFDRGVPGIIKATDLNPRAVDCRYHIDLLVNPPTMGRFEVPFLLDEG